MGDDWGVATTSLDPDTPNCDITTDRVRASQKGGGPQQDAAYIAYMHPERVRRLVREIETLRLAKARRG